jgi:predicted lipid carrier protein YhbT
MMKSIARRQGGLTFSGFLITGILVIFIAVGLMKVIPVYVQDKTIQSVLDDIVHDPDLRDADVPTIKDAFFKRAVTMNNITVVGPDDLIINQTAGGLKLGVNYQVKVPLVGNASLLFEFKTRSH